MTNLLIKKEEKEKRIKQDCKFRRSQIWESTITVYLKYPPFLRSFYFLNTVKSFRTFNAKIGK